MRIAVYNSGIPEANLKPVNRALRFASILCSILRSNCLLILIALLGTVVNTWATDWSGPEQELARKIAAVTGPGAVAVTIENRQRPTLNLLRRKVWSQKRSTSPRRGGG